MQVYETLMFNIYLKSRIITNGMDKIGILRCGVIQMLSIKVPLRSMPVHSFPQIPFGFYYIYQPTKSTLDGIHYVKKKGRKRSIIP